MKTKITPELRQVLIAALVEGEVGLKELGYSLQEIEGVPASASERESWNNYVPVNDEMRDQIRKSLSAGYIDLCSLISVS